MYSGVFVSHTVLWNPAQIPPQNNYHRVVVPNLFSEIPLRSYHRITNYRIVVSHNVSGIPPKSYHRITTIEFCCEVNVQIYTTE